MASVSITVPDALVARLTAALRASYPQYDGLSAANAFKAATGDYWRSILVGYEAGVASNDAQAAVDAQRAQSEADGAGIG